MNSPQVETPLTHGSTSVRIGVDLGGSDIKLGATDLSAERILTPDLFKCASLTQEGPQKTISQITGAIGKLLDELDLTWTDVASVAVTVPCPCSADGVILSVSNLGTPETKHLWQVPFGDLLSVEIGKVAAREIPVFACNDANAAGQDEDFARFGHHTSPRTLVFATTGTGLGGAIVTQHGVFFGRGQAGELGHMKIAVPARYAERYSADPFPPCGCGATGCVEARASLSALFRRITWALSDEGVALIRRDLESRGQTVVPDVLAQLKQHHEQSAKQAAYLVRTFADEYRDPFCRWLLEDWAIMFGALFATVAAALHPDLMVIGGGLTEMSDQSKAWFIDVVKQAYHEVNAQNCFDSIDGNCQIEWSRGRDQGWRGAILMAIHAGQ